MHKQSPNVLIDAQWVAIWGICSLALVKPTWLIYFVRVTYDSNTVLDYLATADDMHKNFNNDASELSSWALGDGEMYPHW